MVIFEQKLPLDLSQILQDYEEALLRYAWGVTRDRETARDVVQETFLQLHRSAATEAPRNVRAWLYTVCRHRAIDELRRSKRQVEMGENHWDNQCDESPDPAARAAQREEVEALWKFISDLPEKEAEVLRLKFQSHLSYREISEITGHTVSYVGYLIHTALQKTRQHFQSTLPKGDSLS